MRFAVFQTPADQRSGYILTTQSYNKLVQTQRGGGALPKKKLTAESAPPHPSETSAATCSHACNDDPSEEDSRFAQTQ
jgi:hypothetical protein